MKELRMPLEEYEDDINKSRRKGFRAGVFELLRIVRETEAGLNEADLIDKVIEDLGFESKDDINQIVKTLLKIKTK